MKNLITHIKSITEWEAIPSTKYEYADETVKNPKELRGNLYKKDR